MEEIERNKLIDVELSSANKKERLIFQNVPYKLRALIYDILINWNEENKKKIRLIEKAHQEAHECNSSKEIHDWIDWFKSELEE